MPPRTDGLHSPPAAEPEPRYSRSRRLPLVLIGIAVAHVAWSRAIWWDIPLQFDTGMWSYMGGRILDGARIYADLRDSKPPGIFYLFAAVRGAFGDHFIAALHLLDSAVTLYLLVAAGLLARRLASPAAVAGGLVLLSLACCNRVAADWGMNAEKFVAAAEMSALCVLFRGGNRKPGRIDWLTAGALCGAAALFKQAGILLFLVLTALLAFGAAGPLWTDAGRGRRHAGWLVCGAAVVWIPVCCAMVLGGVFREFLAQAVLFDLQRATSGGMERGLLLTGGHWRQVGESLKPMLILLAPALLSVFLSFSNARSRADPAVTLMRRVCALHVAALLILFPFAPLGYGHYLLQIAPSAAVLAASALDAAAKRRCGGAACATIALGLAVGACWQNDQLQFLTQPGCDARVAYAAQRNDVRRAADAIAQRTQPNARVLLWPPDPATLVYANRTDALEFTNAFVIPQGVVSRLEMPMAEIIERLNRAPPAIVLDRTSIRVVRGAERVQFAVQGHASLYESGGDSGSALDAVMTPLRTWVAANYGGQEYVDGVGMFRGHGRPSRSWDEVFDETELP